MALATVQDVASRLGRELSPEEEQQVQVLLGDAELLLKARIPDLLDQVAAGTIDENVVVMIEANMVARVMRNPEGFMQESDGNYSYMVQTDVASGRLSVLPDEWGLLGLKNGVFWIVPKLTVPWGDDCPPIWETI